jgi:LuxR family maltose regulon positive regulatory protein
MTTLLAAKLHTPAPPPKCVPRPDLTRRLDEGLAVDRPITLVSAPAGFGKTTCVADWVATLDDRTVSWLSLDPADDDPARFFAYLVAALQKGDPELGRDIEGVLRAGQCPPAEVISTMLGNDLLELDGRVLLVLDDLQTIQDPLIMEVLEGLVAHPPGALHLVLVTREDPPLPLARLRANNWLTEIRARDLRFSPEDAGSLVNEVMGLDLAPDDVAELTRKTEGWAAGLQLAGLSMRDRADPASLIAELSGSHRFILGYLTEEVLNRQPAEIQEFLLATSILDKLNGDLCNAVTGRSDSHALLGRLLDANLFLIPLDEEGRWHRTHRLFADLLRDRQTALYPDKTTELHRRAARWYAGVGRASEAIEHALAGEDYIAAVDLLESHATPMIMAGYAKTVHQWLEGIPAPWRSQSPRADLAFTWMHLLRGDYRGATPYLERLEATVRDRPADAEGRSLRAEWLVIQSLLRNMAGEAAAGMALVEEALAVVPAADDRARGLAYFGLATARQALGQADGVTDAYRQAIAHSRAAEHSIADMMSTSGLAEFAFARGQLGLAAEIATPACARIEASGSLPPISTVVFGILGEVYIQWFRLAEGRRYVERALQLSILGGLQSGVIGCRLLLSRLTLLAGDLEGAAREIETAMALMEGELPAYLRQETAAHQVRVYLAQGRPAAAELALAPHGFSFREGFSTPAQQDARPFSHALGLVTCSALRVLLERAGADSRGHEADLAAGVALADRVVAEALRARLIPVALEGLLTRSRLYALLDNRAASRTDLIQAVTLGEPEGFIGVFIEAGPAVGEALATLARHPGPAWELPMAYVGRILAALGEAPATDEISAPDGRGGMIEPLTDRELDVVRLMAQGLTYREIAADLFISLNTVRYHVKAVYGKLGANNRTKAIAAARRHGVL